jgi:hypothetical protein
MLFIFYLFDLVLYFNHFQLIAVFIHKPDRGEAFIVRRSFHEKESIRQALQNVFQLIQRFSRKRVIRSRLDVNPNSGQSSVVHGHDFDKIEILDPRFQVSSGGSFKGFRDFFNVIHFHTS